MSLKRIFVFSILVLGFFEGMAQKTAIFNGKSYLVYPHYLRVYSSRVSFDEKSLTISGIDLPPIIGMVKDGEYLMYSEKYELVPRGKKSFDQIDTVYKVYATFTVKDNKKEGKADIYDVRTQKFLISLPYKNDVIEGRVRLTENSYEHSEYHYYRYGRRNADVKWSGRFYDVEYAGGMLHGRLRYMGVYRKDTLLIEELTIKDGIKNGPSVKYSYSRKGKKVTAHLKTKGEYTNNKKSGIWETRDNHSGRTIEIYDKGILTYTRHEMPELKMSYVTSYGRDSVMKYVPDFAARKKVPYTEHYWNHEGRDENFVVMYENNNEKKMYFVLDHYASENYYTDFHYAKTVDTLIDGKLFRTYFQNTGLFSRRYPNRYFNEEFYAIDTCRTSYEMPYDYRFLKSSTPAFCKTLLWSKAYDKKHRLKSFVKEEAYYRYLNNDSLKPQLRETKTTRTGLEETYYYKALDYQYTNITLTKSKSKGCRMYYRVSGGYHTGSVIQYIKIPVTGTDTITLVDTLMNKGKYLYVYDSYFNDGYKALLEHRFSYSDDETDSPSLEKKLNQHIYDFFSLSPNLHKTIFYGKRQFTGELQMHVDYKKNPSHAVGTVIEVQSLFSFIEKKLEMHIWVELGKEKLMIGNNAFILPSKLEEYDIDEGLFSGSVIYEDIYNGTSVTTYYFRNAMYSSMYLRTYLQTTKGHDYDADLVYSDRYGPGQELDKNRIYPVQGPSMQYINGKKEGQWTMVDMTGRISSQHTFHNDRQHGLQLVFAINDVTPPYLSYIYHAVNDTVHGKVWALNSNGYPEYEGSFNKGVPEGRFRRYFSDKDTGRFFMQQMQFSNGFLVGKYLEYRDSNTLAMSIDLKKEDSLQFSVFKPLIQEYEPVSEPVYEQLDDEFTEPIEIDQVFMDELYLSRSFKSYSYGNVIFDGYSTLTGVFSVSFIPRGFYTYYYKSGTEFMKGNKKHFKPAGEWRFYREGKDRIYKIIDFKDSILRYSDGDTLLSYGKVRAFYDDGRLMFSGFATDRSSAYSCESGADMPVEEDYYLAFYDTIGKSMLVNGSGMIREHQANGYVLKEGRIENNKKEGMWIYYTKFGLPEKIGTFKNGKKNGRWLSGDLGGLNLDEHICYMSDEEFRSWINTFGGDLNLEESYYLNGKRISVNQVNTIKH